MKIRQSAPKAKNSKVRELSSAETYARVRPHLRRVGVTRVANITWLDRIGIPVFVAICPRSNDVISVYNGKGLADIDAKTSAVMEAIERFAAGLPVRPHLIASYEEFAQGNRSVMNPREHNLELSHHYREDFPIMWASAWDLLNEECVLVPQDGVVYGLRKPFDAPCYMITTSNGLAAGNTLEEAICHALAEIIERDALTLSDLVSNRLSNVLGRELLPDGAADFRHWLGQLHPHVDMSTLPPRAQTLVEHFTQANIRIYIIHITSDVGIPSFLVHTVEDLGPTNSMGHWGMGTHPDAEVALIRAITECAQSRAADLQATREDISLPADPVSKHQFHAKRQASLAREGWARRPTEKLAKFTEIRSNPTDDVIDDLSHMLNQVKECGFRQVLVVDLSPPGIPVKVVRVLVPGMESWVLDYSKIGPRATEVWNQAVRAVKTAWSSSWALPMRNGGERCVP